MAITDIELLDAFESFGEESVQSRLLLAKLADKGFEATSIVNTLYSLIDQEVLAVGITGKVQRA